MMWKNIENITKTMPLSFLPAAILEPRARDFPGLARFVTTCFSELRFAHLGSFCISRARK